ncbi:hypothetical protein ACFO9Q_01030 [Paenibacillus sp. GCM10023252]|uniref:hypothetical protein n=1 Tax=Paenibacillus sp. GCM10023252 TaxID=3252649 RepID=UPI003619D2D5
MLRNRNFLVGLGTGMIAGALLLQVMIVGEQSQRALTLPAEQTSEVEETYTQAQLDEMVSTARAEGAAAAAQAAASEGSSSPAPQSTSKPSPKPSPKPSSKPETTPAADVVPDKPVIVRIIPNSDLTGIAKLLHSNGVLRDQAAFIKEMEQSGKLVRAGYFELKPGLSTSEVMKVITSTPLDPDKAKQRLAKS